MPPSDAKSAGAGDAPSQRTSTIEIVKSEDPVGEQHEGAESEHDEDEEEVRDRVPTVCLAGAVTQVCPSANLPQDKPEDELDQQGEPWLGLLLEHSYDGMDLEHRVAMLSTLCHLALDSPTIRCVEITTN